MSLRIARDLPAAQEQNALEFIVARAEWPAIGNLVDPQRRDPGCLDAGYPLHLRGPAPLKHPTSTLALWGA